MTTTIRVSTTTRDLLQELAQRSGTNMQSILERAIEQYRRQQLLEATNAAYAQLEADTEAWIDNERERVEWDQTLEDGLAGV